MTVDYRKELKRVGIGIFFTAPLIALYILASFLVDNWYVNPATISYTIMGISILFMCWTTGGAYEALQEMKRNQTDQAFRKLGHKD